LLEKIRFVQIGLGPMGSSICRLAIEKEGIEIVGAVDLMNVGKDVSEVLGLRGKLGVRVTDDVKSVLTTKPDIVLHSTVSSLKMAEDQLETILKAKVSVISTCEELAYPWDIQDDIAYRLDSIARENKVVILGTGVNPGFCMDTFPIALTAVCQSVVHVRVARVQDARSRRLSFQKKIGAGCNLDEFEQMKKTGKLRHMGLRESTGMIAAAMGWSIEDYDETIEPVIADKEIRSDYFTVMKGQPAGVAQIATAKVSGRETIRMEFKAYLGAPDSYDTIWITGVPNLEVTVNGGIQGDLATSAIVTNAIPRVLSASPGLKTMKDMPIVHTFMGNLAKFT